MMKFSILTVTRNAEAYLKECLESVQKQSYPYIEHILFDGGSQDNTLKIASAFPHLIVKSGKDTGISDAMNQAASFATGDFLIHLHADDCLAAPNILEKIAILLKQHPNITWLYGKAHVIDEDGKLKKETPFLPDAAERLWKYNTITHPAVVISRDLFLRSRGFKTDWHYCMDYDLWLRLAKLSSPFPFSGTVAAFREHPGSCSTSEPLAVAKEAYLVRNQYLKNPWKKLRSYRTYKRRCKKYLDFYSLSKTLECPGVDNKEETPKR